MKKRCPWCGEVLINCEIIPSKSGVQKCKKCKRYSCLYYKYSLFFLVLIIFPLLLWIISSESLDKHTVIFLCAIMTVLGTVIAWILCLMPQKRMNMDGEVSDESLEEKNLGYYSIKWFINPKKVFGCYNNTIIFLCAVSQYDDPITNMYCVRVTKKRGKYKITQIDDRIDHTQIESLFHLKSARLNLYNEKKLVGSLILDSMDPIEK